MNYDSKFSIRYAFAYPPYSELETNDSDRLRRETPLTQASQDATYCVHYSSIRRILNSEDLTDGIARYPEGDRTHVEHYHQVAADTPQDPRILRLRKQDPTTGTVTVINADEDPWDLDVILLLPDGASTVDAEVELLESTRPWWSDSGPVTSETGQ